MEREREREKNKVCSMLNREHFSERKKKSNIYVIQSK